jgi:hypothetical protein
VNTPIFERRTDAQARRARPTSFSWKARATARSTKIRRTAVQRWPVVAAIEIAASETARSRSASGADDHRVAAAELEREQLLRCVDRRERERAARSRTSP